MDFKALRKDLHPKGSPLTSESDFAPMIASKPKGGQTTVKSKGMVPTVPWKVRELRPFALHVAGIKRPHQYKQQELYQLCKTKLANQY